MKVHATDMHIISTTMLCTEQKGGITCKKLASQLSHSKKCSFKSVIMSANGILQKQQYIHGLKFDITIAPHLLLPTILHGFHDSKCHQGTICTCEEIRSYWWPGLGQDIVKYIGKCSICAKHLPNMAKYPKQHLEIPQIPMAVLAIDTVGHLPITSKGNRWALTVICLYTSYMCAILMKAKSAENVIQAYLCGILADKCRSVAILSDNGTEFKNSPQ